MKELLQYLEAIRQTAKDLHYNASGASFYGIHLLADRISDPLAGFIDDIKEVAYLGQGKAPPSSKELADGFLPLLAQDTSQTAILPDLGRLVSLAVYTIEELSRSPITQGELNLLGAISQHLTTSYGLLSRTTAEK